MKGAARPNNVRAARAIARMERATARSTEIIERPTLEMIDAEIRRATAVYDRAIELQDRREALGYWLANVVQLINHSEAQREAGLASPGRDLLTALMSLQGGGVEPLFERGNPGPGAPPLVNAALFRAYAAAAAKVLTRGGGTAKAADGWVADRLHAAGHRKAGERGDSITRTTIQGWRREAREAVADAPIRRSYERWLAAPDIGEPEADAEYMIASLRRRFSPPQEARGAAVQRLRSE